MQVSTYHPEKSVKKEYIPYKAAQLAAISLHLWLAIEFATNEQPL